jgi:deazaflavin-dependent oxidoreductase (nitroreductase family)
VGGDFIHSMPARAAGWMAKRLASWGISRLVVLTTIGRRSGEAREVPLAPIRHDGITYLVAPYGEVSWVHNVRAHPEATLRRGRSVRDVILHEVDHPEVVKRYYEREPIASRFMAVPGEGSVADFAAVTGRFPVFRVDER